jgi:hypothetical protein
LVIERSSRLKAPSKTLNGLALLDRGLPAVPGSPQVTSIHQPTSYFVHVMAPLVTSARTC